MARSQQSAAAHALYALQHNEGIDVAAALQNGGASAKKTARASAADATPELRVAPPLAIGAGWDSPPQPTPV